MQKMTSKTTGEKQITTKAVKQYIAPIIHNSA